MAITGKRRLEPGQLRQLAVFVDVLRQALEARGRRLAVWQGYERVLGSAANGLPEVDNAAGLSLIVSVGGDGTLLRAARLAGDHETPLLGVNSGHLGFMSAIGLADAPAMVPDIADGRLAIEERRLLMVETNGLDADADVESMRDIQAWPYALNEVAVLRDDTASMISIDARLNGMPLATYRADGLVVSTPTGSTAYNLSVGGPIMAPGTRTWALSPVAAHQLTMRPIVVSDDSELWLRVESRAPRYRLSLDGRSASLPLSCAVRITRAPFVVKLAHMPGHNFADTLRAKLRFSE